MITTANGRTFEIFLGGTIAEPSYYAQTHCWCGSTMGSGEWQPTIEKAIAEAAENIADHERAGKHAPTKPCDACGHASKAVQSRCFVCSGRGVVRVHK